MFLFELVIALLLVGAVLCLAAKRIGVPYPALLALTGAMLALIPGVPEVSLDPDLALALFVAPTLLDAAYDASLRDLRDNLYPVTSLALGAVAFTIVVVALVVHAFAPAMGWAAAITLGAIVAPPDASAATAVLRQLSLPHRLMVILEGESLFNDATALLIYRVAAAAAVTGAFSGWSVAGMLVLTGVGGLVAGIVLARLYLWLSAPVHDIPISIVLQFISTFGVWLIAEHIDVSPIITVVCYAITISRYVAGRMEAKRRIASYAVWEVVVFVLNVLAFVLIGLQLRGVVTRLALSQWALYGSCAAAVSVSVIIARIIWVMSQNAIARWNIRRFGVRVPRPMMLPSIGSGMIMSLCGMRGIVTLAAALALPAAFPYRDLIVLCAFSVVLTTLVVQGLSLRWLIERIGLHGDGVVEKELGRARAETARAALQELEADSEGSLPGLRQKYQMRIDAGERQAAGLPPARPEPALNLQRRIYDAQRKTLIDLRARDVIGDAAFQAAEEELDLLELAADRMPAIPDEPR
jgi:monovalent cation/hydrogen antiporter